MSEVDVVTVGECLVSLVAMEPGRPLASAERLDVFAAGAEANVAVGLARLGHRVAYVGRVGADGFGEAVRRRLRGEGVDVDLLTSDPDAPTGVMVRELRGLGPSEVLYLRRGSAGSRLSVADIEAAAPVIASARWLHVTGITPSLSASAQGAIEAAIEAARSRGLTVSLDLNLRRKLWPDSEAAPVLRHLAGLAEVLLGSLDECTVVAGLPSAAAPGEAALALRALGPATVVVKLGATGALILDADGGQTSRPGVPIAVVTDPVGAGDAFSAGYIAARLRGLDDVVALDWANACGASVAAAVGDMTGLPTLAELERLLDRASATTPDTIR